MSRTFIFATCCCIVLGACGTQPMKPADTHLRSESEPPRTIPAPVTQSLPVPVPKPAPRQETYSVVVNNVPAHELLFALARDAKVNVDIHSGIQGTVTLNAIDQTLPQILSRIAKQIDMRYEIDGPNLVVMPDTPFLRHYRIDYVNMARDATSTVSIATQVGSPGTAPGPPASGTSQAAGASSGSTTNASTTSVINTAKNHFWDTLVQNVKDILRETDKILPEGSSETVVQQSNTQSTTGTGSPSSSSSRNPASLASSPNPATLQDSGTTLVRRTTFREAASVIANPETGTLTIRATSRQHGKIQEFLDQVMASARRQVLIEATVLEVQLSDQYQQGINWSRLRLDGTGFTIAQAPAGTPLPLAGVTENPNLFTLAFRDPGSKFGNIAATITLLETFGTVKVLSSPKVSVLNNQTAVLKVVDNRVYFTVTSQLTPVTTGSSVTFLRTINTTAQTVPVGLIMSVTPQISENDLVTMNIRPTVSRITRFVEDPNPDLVEAGVSNRIPEIQSREMESILKVGSGQIAVMGGLMQDSVNHSADTVPGLSRIPLLGKAFTHRDEQSTKSELVIFLRPLVIREASMEGDYRSLKDALPDENFFTRQPESRFFEERPETGPASDGPGGH